MSDFRTFDCKIVHVKSYARCGCVWLTFERLSDGLKFMTFARGRVCKVQHRKPKDATVQVR